MPEFLTNLFENISHPGVNSLLLIGIAIFFGTIGGRLFQKIKIPQVVGYIFIGILVGPLLKIISLDTLKSFEPFNSFALGLIGFTIGGELRKDVVKKYGKQFVWILFFEALSAFFLVGILTFLVVTLLLKSWQLGLVYGLLLGSISSATAAAGTTDVLWEYKTKGPLTTTVLGIVALDDILALILFAICSSVAGLFTTAQDSSLLHELLKLLYEVGFSLLLGWASGRFFTRILKSHLEEEKLLTFSIGGIILVLGLAVALKVDMILTAMVMGIVLTNVAPKKSKDVFKVLEKISTPIYVMFFVFVGAKLNIKTMNLNLIILVIVFLLGRSFGKAFGASLGAKLGKAAPTVVKYLPLCLLSQSGAAIGLSIIAGQKFEGPIGSSVMLIVTTTTFIVQLIGPIFIKAAVTKAGEVGLNITEEDLIKQCHAIDGIMPDMKIMQETMNLGQILQTFSENDELFYPVLNNSGQLVGILSIEGVKNAFMANELSEFLLAHDLMDPVSRTCLPDTSLSEVQYLMTSEKLSCIPVIDKEQKILGVIEPRSIQKTVSQKILQLQQQAEALG
ncbi:MAG: cation:proton antiporter [Spirochaetales bacterium]|nr:cation:proton antiporter [Spirochaetales bacterium]